MTPRRRGRGHARLNRRTVPTLTAFVRGYLHQDWTVEHGTVENALAAFSADADTRERQLLAQDVEALLGASERWPIEQLQRFFVTELGSAWVPRDGGDLRRLAADLRAG